MQMRESIQNFLQQRFRRYFVSGICDGTYGTVYILEESKDSSFSISPKKFCVKTINPEKIKLKGKSDLKSLFERELRIWLRLPNHLNVLPALGLEFVPAPDKFRFISENIPLVRMPYCDLTLSDWIKSYTKINEVDRLIAISQLCNGLLWLYSQGIQGHGDLKPDNIFVMDLRNKFQLSDEGFPSKQHPWNIRVADLGWADIWRDLGGSEHAWRPYIAPERFEGTFVPIKSDIYAVGVIAVELMQGKHPAGEKTDKLSKWKSNKMKKWAHNGERDLADIENKELKPLFLQCLSSEPDERPQPQEVIDALSAILDKTSKLELKSLLELWSEVAQSENQIEHMLGWAEEASKVSPNELNMAIQKVEELFILSKGPDSDTAIANWIRSGLSLARLLLRRGNGRDIERVKKLCGDIIEFILDNFSNLDLRTPIYGISGEESDIEP